MAQSRTTLAGPAATLLLLAFKAGAAPRPLPRGAEISDLQRAFPTWRITDTEAASTDGMPKPLRRAAPTWYQPRCLTTSDASSHGPPTRWAATLRSPRNGVLILPLRIAPCDQLCAPHARHFGDLSRRDTHPC